ncbi:MAG: hypothetical protein IPO00_16505 [Betaproteobacteria bacterium]|nr:hypothetical protein [Betaproteobacteria bacterium]
MQHGATDFESFTRAMTAAPAAQEDERRRQQSNRNSRDAKRETQALLMALREQPTDAGLREELKQNLETLKQDADLVADNALGQQAKAALSALNSGGDTTPAFDAAMPA